MRMKLSASSLCPQRSDATGRTQHRVYANWQLLPPVALGDGLKFFAGVKKTSAPNGLSSEGAQKLGTVSVREI